MQDGSDATFTLNTRISQTAGTELYRGYWDADGTPVVVKVLRREHPSPTELARLRQEFAILRSLDQPNVVKALALQPYGHGLALVLEDAGDFSLDQLIQSRRLDLGRSLAVAAALSRVLAEVHRNGIVHKDIKPQHFFVHPEDPNRIKLIDFGLATRLLRHTQAQTPLTLLEGTLAYVAPEQTGRMNRVIDQRSDLYSLGVTLFELFTGVLPFQSADPLELVHSHIARKPRAPHEVSPTVPEVLSRIILKLLAKVAEERYQSADGLRHDLERCLQTLKRGGEISDFLLGDRDLSGELNIPQKLYGRQQQIQSLRAALERAARGRSELLLIAGYSGVGKSALAAELRQRLDRESYFVSGKFELLARGIPYAPIMQVCRQLVHSLLAEPPEVLARRQQIVRDSLGQNGKLLIDLVPDLELLVGPQPEVAKMGPVESQVRFELLMQRFLSCFGGAERPLVVFLDDLQWADPASLRLLELLLTDPAGHILVLGAYRDNEVDSVHPLALAVEQLKKAGVAVSELSLRPLELSHVTELLAETLHSTHDEVSSLAETLFTRCDGNPFYLLQLLSTAHKEGLVSFDSQAQCWQWDVERIRHSIVADNVVEFMLARLGELSSPTQAVIRIAACIGYRFDHDTLAAVCGCSAPTLRAGLWEALQAGVVVPLDDNYRFSVEASVSGAEPSSRLPDASYRFLHDRVQQAAYALIDDAQKAEVHLNIGRLLLARSGSEPQDDELFAVLDHLNKAVGLVPDRDEQLRLARLNLAAGQKALSAAAPAASTRYLQASLDLLGAAGWLNQYSEAFRAHLLKAECEYLLGNLDAAFRLLDQIEQHAATVLDRVAGRHLKSVLLVKTGQVHLACVNTVETASLLGIVLPSPDDKPAMGAATGAEFGAYQAALAGRSIESLAGLPQMTDPEHLARMRTVTGGFPAAFQSNQEQFALLVLKAVAMTLQHGTAPSSPLAYAQYGVVHWIVTSDFETAYRFGKLAVDLCRGQDTGIVSGATYFIYGGFLSHWHDHVSSSIEHLRQGLRLCLDSGDLEYAAYCASVAVHYRIYAGENLEEIQASLLGAAELAQRTGDVVNQGFCTVARQLIACLQGRTLRWGSLTTDDFNVDAFKSMPYAVQSFAATAMTMAHYLAGNYEEAVASADTCSPLPANFFNGEHVFYRALALAQLARRADAERREELLSRLQAEAATLAVWAAQTPSNHASRHALIAAELADIQGHPLQAMEQYEKAIASARASSFSNQEAVANELCASFHLASRRNKVADCYWHDARYCYERWGATGKLRDLDAKYPQLSEPAVHRRSPGGRSESTPEMWTRHANQTLQSETSYHGGTLDVSTMMRATEAIVSDLVLDQVVERLMRALLENAGAQRGTLLLRRGDGMEVAAVMSVDPDTVQVRLSGELTQVTEYSTLIVQYVARVRQGLVFDDASSDHRFASDPYVSTRRPRSVLCIPMLHRGGLIGVLYLENNLASGAFSPTRKELLQFVAAQAASAIENARLYGELKQATDQLRLSNENLEHQVSARTEELRKAVAELWSEVDLAHKIQSVLLPQNLELPDYEVAAAMVPTHDVGGDYYDVIPSAGQNWVLIGDVSGHGVTAGLVMMMVQSAIRTAVIQSSNAAELSPAAMLSRVNAALWNNLQQIGGTQYMTISALRLSGNTVHYAGLHESILVYRAATGTVEAIQTTGIWIGIVDDTSALLQDQTLRLGPGDVILLYTDGITERLLEDGKLLGTAGLIAQFETTAARSSAPSDIVKAIMGPLASKPARDDLTVVAVRYAPGSPA